MKKPGASSALLSPNTEGWRVLIDGRLAQTAKTLDEAAASVPASARIHLALPTHLALLERMRLPSTDKQELVGMAQLQLEKSLPFPIDEVTTDFEVVRLEEKESTLLSIAANTSQLDALCQPLKSRSRVPQKITLYALHVAAACSPDETVFCVWPEDGQLVIAVSEHGKLGYAYSLPAMDEESVLGELPGLLLGAEMEGVPTDFDRIRIEQGCAHLREPLSKYFGKSVEIISFDTPLPEPEANLLPESWQDEVARIERTQKLKSQLQLAAVVYLLIVAAAFVYLAVLKNRVRALDLEIAETQPKIDLTQAREARWNSLTPAVDPQRYVIEVMRALWQNRPSPELKFTLFDFTPQQWTLEGEAASANEAIDFLERLRKEETLSEYRLDAKPPTILPNDHASFRITGKR